MEAVRNIKVHKIIFFIVLIILIVNGVLVEKLNRHYVDVVEFDASKGYHREQHDDYYITVGKASFLGGKVTASVSTNEIYYSDENSTIIVSFNILADKYGKNTYYISFDDYDDGKEDFGGYVYVDENMKILPENEYATVQNEYLQTLMENNHEHIQRLVQIANDRWNLELKLDPKTRHY